jgi:hypothetical protein
MDQEFDGSRVLDSFATTRVPKLMCQNSCAKTRVPKLVCQNSCAKTRGPKLVGQNSMDHEFDGSQD